MTGPSAIGSLKGKPTSIRSTPVASSSRNSWPVAAISGSPAARKGMNAFFFAARSWRKRSSMAFMRLLDDLARQARHFITILVAAAGEADDHDVVHGPFCRHAHALNDGMGGFQCRQDAFQPRTGAEHRQRLGIADAGVAHPARIAPQTVFWPDAGVIEPGG